MHMIVLLLIIGIVIASIVLARERQDAAGPRPTASGPAFARA